MSNIANGKKDRWDIRLGVLYRCHTSSETLTLPDDVHTIAEGAFEHVEATSIRIPDHVKIRPGGFKDSLIQKVVLPQNLKRIEDYTFFHCKNLRHVEIPPALTYIGRFAFAECPSLKEWNASQLFFTIDEGAFAESGLKNLRIKCKVIGRKAFWSCKSLEQIELEDTLVIEDKAFARCTALRKPVLNEPLLRIGDHAFRECEKLFAVRLPHSVQECGYKAFADVHSLYVEAPKKLRVLFEDDYMLARADEDYCQNDVFSKSQKVFEDSALIHYT